MLKTGFELSLVITDEDILMYSPDTGVRQARDDQPTWPDSVGNWHTYTQNNVERHNMCHSMNMIEPAQQEKKIEFFV